MAALSEKMLGGVRCEEGWLPSSPHLQVADRRFNHD
jgi:hypothetical protein